MHVVVVGDWVVAVGDTCCGPSQHSLGTIDHRVGNNSANFSCVHCCLLVPLLFQSASHYHQHICYTASTLTNAQWNQDLAHMPNRASLELGTRFLDSLFVEGTNSSVYCDQLN